MKELFTIPEACAYVQCCDATMRRLVKSGSLLASFCGGKYLIDGASLAAFVRLRKRSPRTAFPTKPAVAPTTSSA